MLIVCVSAARSRTKLVWHVVGVHYLHVRLKILCNRRTVDSREFVVPIFSRGITDSNGSIKKIGWNSIRRQKQWTEEYYMGWSIITHVLSGTIEPRRRAWGDVTIRIGVRLSLIHGRKFPLWLTQNVAAWSYFLWNGRPDLRIGTDRFGQSLLRFFFLAIPSHVMQVPAGHFWWTGWH